MNALADEQLDELASFAAGDPDEVVEVEARVLAALVDEVRFRRQSVTTGGPAPAMTPPEVWRNETHPPPPSATDSPATVVRRGPLRLVEVDR